MRYRPLGESGLVVSVAGLGCNNFGGRLDLDGTRAVVDAAIDAGITLFDTSDTYGRGGGSERALGETRLSRRRPEAEPRAQPPATASWYRAATFAPNMDEYEICGVRPPCSYPPITPITVPCPVCWLTSARKGPPLVPSV
jgi:hypothetical protein